MNVGLYVQYGCGWDATPGWFNYDASPTLRIERIPIIGRPISLVLKRNAVLFPREVRYGDIVKGLPLPAGSCAGVYCSHVLEHLSLDQFNLALLNTARLLVKNGIFRLVVPDLAFYIKQYIECKGADAAPNFMQATGLGEETRNHGIKGLAVNALGNSRHRWMWDYESLEKSLSIAGFVEIRRARFHDSADEKFNEVERQDRWQNCLGIECRRAR